MFYRQKLLLAILQTFGGKLHHTDLQKYLFLFTTKYQKEKSYDFVPYKYGCFSFQSYADLRNLNKKGFLGETSKYIFIDSDYNFADQIKPLDFSNLKVFHADYKNVKGRDLIKKVYLDFPYYAINSEIANDILSKAELFRIKEEKPKAKKEREFFTIGYEGISLEVFLNKLINKDVKLLCDVRANPISRKYGFSKKTLEGALNSVGIKYSHIPELGIQSQKRKNLKTVKDYEDLFKEYEETILKTSQDVIEQLYQTFLRNKRVAITCFEANPCMCHRSKILDALTQLPDWSYSTKHL